MNTNYKGIIWATTMLLMAFAASAMATARPELPEGCSHLAAPLDVELTFHAYAIGVQIYRWNGASWELVAPDATLFAEDGHTGKVAKHFAGPTWESNSGSKVVGKKSKECTPDASAIPWLLLDGISNDGRGIFTKVGSIQRVNTVGGLKPTNAHLRSARRSEFHIRQNIISIAGTRSCKTTKRLMVETRPAAFLLLIII